MANGKGKFLQTIIDISGEISPTLGKSLDGVVKKLDGVNGKALAAGAAIGGIAVGTAVMVGKTVKALAKLGDEYNSAMNDLSASTGLVGDELAGMGDVIKDVYGSNFGESMGDVASGVAEIHKQTGLVEEDLAATTKGAYALADTFGYDVAESARAAKAMMTNFGVSGEEAMGLIAAGAQNGLDYSGELIDSVNEYSVQFAKLGFSADDMFHIFQEGADSGAWNLDKVGDAVKEFSIRSIDGSKTTTEAFKALGLDADEMMKTFAAGGDDASIAFQGVLTSLMDMDDQVARDAIGVSLFGTQWEDLGVEAMAAMADIQSGAYDTEDALGKINAVKYNNIEDAFEGIKRQAEVSLLPIASTIANAFTQIAPVIGSLFEELGPIIEQVTADAMPFITEFIAGLMDFLPQVMPMISELAGAILPLLSEFVSMLLPPLLDLIRQLLPPIIEIVQMLLPPLSRILAAVLPILTTLLSAVMPILLNGLSNLITFLEPIVLLLADVVGWVAKVIGWVAEGATWVVDLLFGGGDDVAEAAKVNGYATGGFTDGLSIAGEDPRYPTEAVISFNPAYRSQNLSYWARAGQMLGADIADYTLGSSSDGGSVNLGGITFAPNITITVNADKESIMEAIEEEYPEFIDMLESWFAKRGVTTYA